MTTRAGIVTGTALALVMAAGHAWASPPTGEADPATANLPLLIAQADDGAQADDEALNEEERREQAPPAEEAPAAQETPPAEEAPVPEPAPPAPEAPAPEERPATREAPAEEAPTAAEPVPGQPPAEAAPPPATAPTPPAQPAPTPPPAGGGAEPMPGQPPADATPPEQPAPTPPPAQPAPTPPASGGAEPIPGQPPAEATPPPATAPTPPAQPAPTPPPAGGGAEPIPGQPPAEATPPPADATPPGQPAPTPPTDGAAEPVRDAPLLDSQKEAEDAAPAGATRQLPAEPAAPPPASDVEAQQLEEPVEIESLRAEEGRRIDRREERRERREGSDVLREIGDRLLIQLGNSLIVQSDDRDRLGHDASEVYYEELPRGRTRETVVRPNGVQIVTVYDRWGDVIRRSRVMPDGREHVLVWAGGDRDREERRQWRDPGLDLPPLRLGIPAEEYTLDARRARDERAYYDFLNQPPVEPVRRLYSVDEVRYSARVRDSVRRVEMDTITFDFGSASISEEVIPLLAGVAHAIGQLLDENPAEVFLIEGHTDAVGSEEANLALSDRRAEAVAMALTNVFSIPPENMVTQGYGKRYLKINTAEPERQNRRVVMRRITPLVAPVASSQ